jgi:hypothetical protein
MAVVANTFLTYDAKGIREDLGTLGSLCRDAQAIRR